MEDAPTPTPSTAPSATPSTTSEGAEGADDTGRARMPSISPKAIILFWLGFIAVDLVEGVVHTLKSLLIVLAVSLFLSFRDRAHGEQPRSPGLAIRRATGLVFLVVASLSGARVRDRFARLRHAGAPLRRRGARLRMQDVEDSVNDTFNTDVDFNDLSDEFKDPNRRGPQLRERPRRQRVEGRPHRSHGRVPDLYDRTVHVLSRRRRTASAAHDLLRPAPQAPTARVEHVEARDRQDGRLSLSLDPRRVVDRLPLDRVAVSSACRIRSRLHALWVGVVSQFIPVIGTSITGTLAVGVAFLDPVDGIIVLGFVTSTNRSKLHLSPHAWPRRRAHCTRRSHSGRSSRAPR